MNSLLKRAVKTMVEVEVPIPALDGETIQERVKVQVEALKDPVSGEVFFDTAALAELERVKARYMGLLSPEEITTLRRSLGLTQKEISQLLQIGEKSYTRWESGKERPSRSLNILLRALGDGHLTTSYLEGLRQRAFDWRRHLGSLYIECLSSRDTRPIAIPIKGSRTGHARIATAA